MVGQIRFTQYVCPKCGNIERYSNSNPICSKCGNKNVITINLEQFRDILREIEDRKIQKYANNELCYAKIPDKDWETIYKYIRQKYVYNNNSFDQNKYDERIQNDEIEVQQAIKARHDRERAEREATRPRCPTCHSTDIKPITATQKAGSFLMLGIFSQKIKHQFHCNHCGYEW